MRLLAILLNPSFQSVFFLAFSVWWMLRKPEDKTRPWLVMAFVLNLFYGFMLNRFMMGENSLVPWKYDQVLHNLDQALGIHAASVARPLQGFWRAPLLVVYQSLVPMMIVWFLISNRYGKRGSLIPAYAAELAVGPLLYSLVPGCGPLYAFGKQWLNPPAVPAEIIRLNGMPNAFPSLHAATALVFVFFAPTRWARAFSLIFLVVTLMGTLSTGEHYVIDLIPGLAFGAFAASVGQIRIRRAVGFLVIAVSWSLGARFGNASLIAHPPLVQSCVAITLLLVVAAIWKEWSSRPATAFEAVLPIDEPAAIQS